MTSTILQNLFDLNTNFPIYRLGEAQPIMKDQSWGGGRVRRMLQCIYTIAFLCLLRFDEVLKIQAHHIEVIDEAEGHIKLTLPFRKTHKHGGLSSFCLSSLLTFCRNQALPLLEEHPRTSFRCDVGYFGLD